jgi:murein tripeptide amidase MpaA
VTHRSAVRRSLISASSLLLALGGANLARAQSTRSAETAILPPELPWAGTSRALVAAASDPWITPSEKTGLLGTPSYAETMAWIARLDEASPQVARTVIGQSPEGRDLVLVIVSKEGAATPAALAANGRPTLFAQAGIHAGEIDGKDAGMMFLRDLTVGGSRRALLDRANFLFVPIFNVDGHERSTRFGRINQRGPVESGWRTTSNNLNLNRDYTKLDAPETRAMIAALVAWKPDLYADLHVTDGADYQYDITWGSTGVHGFSPRIAAWLEGPFTAGLTRDLAAAGHQPGPLINFIEEFDPQRGIIEWTAGPRFSHGYGDLVHLPSVLVENHSLKPYPQRVLGTRVLLESMLTVLGRDGAALRAALRDDAARRPAALPIAWGPAETPATIDFRGVTSRVDTSAISGGKVMRWLGQPVTQKLPYVRLNRPTATVSRPRAYWIPPASAEVIERLRNHGVAMEVLSAPREVEVEMDRLSNVVFGTQPFEGHTTVTADAKPERRRETMPRGAVRISTDQPLGDLVVLTLEPSSPDSFFQWGFFLESLQRTEYGESYVVEPMAQAMLAADPALRAEFESQLKDPKFAGDPAARLDFFYRRTPFFDERANLYPVARER